MLGEPSCLCSGQRLQESALQGSNPGCGACAAGAFICPAILLTQILDFKHHCVQLELLMATTLLGSCWSESKQLKPGKQGWKKDPPCIQCSPNSSLA